jgi:hypothetical protein
MIGGTAYVAHKAGQASAENQMREQEQEQRIQQLESQQYAAPPQQQYAPPPPQYAPPPPAPAAGGGTDVVSQLTELAKLRDAGVLSPEEFEAAKAKLLA